MSSISENGSSLAINHSPTAIREILLNAEHLPDWNPALTQVSPTAEQNSYSIVVRNTLHGTMSCTEAQNNVFLDISIPGLHEVSTFTIRPTANGCIASRDIFQQGFLARIIGKKRPA